MSIECDDILHLRCCICLENTVRFVHQIENQTVHLIFCKQTNHFKFCSGEKCALLIFLTFGRKNYNVSILQYILACCKMCPKLFVMPTTNTENKQIKKIIAPEIGLSVVFSRIFLLGVKFIGNHRKQSEKNNQLIVMIVARLAFEKKEFSHRFKTY